VNKRDRQMEDLIHYGIGSAIRDVLRLIGAERVSNTKFDSLTISVYKTVLHDTIYIFWTEGTQRQFVSWEFLGKQGRDPMELFCLVFERMKEKLERSIEANSSNAKGSLQLVKEYLSAVARFLPEATVREHYEEADVYDPGKTNKLIGRVPLLTYSVVKRGPDVDSAEIKVFLGEDGDILIIMCCGERIEPSVDALLEWIRGRYGEYGLERIVQEVNVPSKNARR